MIRKGFVMSVILTGIPHGVGMAAKPPRWLRPGDRVTVEIERIGQLMNPVEAEAIPDTMQVSLEPRDRRRSIATV